MKNMLLRGFGAVCALGTICLVSAEEAALLPPDCEQRLERFVPTEVNTSDLAMRAVMHATNHVFQPTGEMIQRQLRDQYWGSEELQGRFATPEDFIRAAMPAVVEDEVEKIRLLTELYWTTEQYQKDFPGPEAFIEVVLPSIAIDEDRARSVAPRHWKAEVIVAKTYAYARHYDTANGSTPTQEVFRIKGETRAWRTIHVDHSRRQITEKIEQQNNEYHGYFMALTPQEAHRGLWVTWYPLMLRAEQREESLGELLCATGSIELGELSLEVEFTGENRCTFTSRKPVPDGVLHTEYDLEQNRYVRLLRYQLRGPELSTSVTYEYHDPESPWPSKQHLVDRNLLSDQILQDRTMEILEVTPAEKWDINALLESKLEKYKDYSVVTE